MSKSINDFYYRVKKYRKKGLQIKKKHKRDEGFKTVGRHIFISSQIDKSLN